MTVLPRLDIAWWWRKKKFAHRQAGTTPTFVSAEIGTVDASTVAITFSQAVALSDLASGVVVKVNTVTRTVLSATRSSTNAAAVRYVLATPVTSADTVTWAYTAASGYIVAQWRSAPLANVSAQAVTNNAPPPAPTNLAAMATSDTEIDLTWDDNASDEDGYEVQRSTDGGASYTTVHTTAANVEAWTDSGLTPETEYGYRVRATNAGHGPSAWSTMASETTEVTPGAGFALLLESGSYLLLESGDKLLLE